MTATPMTESALLGAIRPLSTASCARRGKASCPTPCTSAPAKTVRNRFSIRFSAALMASTGSESAVSVVRESTSFPRSGLLETEADTPDSASPTATCAMRRSYSTANALILMLAGRSASDRRNFRGTQAERHRRLLAMPAPTPSTPRTGEQAYRHASRVYPVYWVIHRIGGWPPLATRGRPRQLSELQGH